MKEQMRIVKGFEVNSRPIGEKGTRCRYTTTKEMTLQPLSLEHARLSTDPDGVRSSACALTAASCRLEPCRSQPDPVLLQR
jgi:type VI protein secretion system component VasA